MKSLTIFLKTTLVLLLMSSAVFGQHYMDWEGFEYLPGRYDSNDHIVFYELQKDYTVNLAEYFLDAEKLPDCCEEEVNIYNQIIRYLSPCDWDFISLEFGGILTVKKGYRWDGASYLCKSYTGDSYCPDEYHNFRSSLVHDAIYDLMRMAYLEADHHHQLEIEEGTCVDTHILWDAGDYNRKMADMIHYMIAIEDGDSKDNAQSDYFWLRVWGACPSHDESKLKSWKYHVSDLTAYPIDGVVELEWKRTNEAMKDPDGTLNASDYYSIRRDGLEIATMNVFEFQGWPPLITWLTSFTDNTAIEGNIYSYQVVLMSENENQDNWSNEDIIVPQNGPGNALVLDGSNDYVEANTVSNDYCYNRFPVQTMPLTMEAWVFPEEPAKNAAIMAFNTISGGNHNMLFYNSGNQKFVYYDNSTSYLYSTDEFPIRNWYHIAVTINDQNQGVMYVNGMQQATYETAVRPSRGARFSIGQEWDTDATSQHFKGMIDEVRIWRTERTQEEIKSTMYLPLRGNEPGLVGVWHFDEPSHLRKTYGATVNANDGLLLGYELSDIAFVPSEAMVNPTAIQDNDVDDQLPKVFALHQNYANPFNPTTTIGYQLAKKSNVVLRIYNALGQKVATLVSKQQSAGYYTVDWNAADFSSGIYMYKIETDNGFIAAKKLILLK